MKNIKIILLLVGFLIIGVIRVNAQGLDGKVGFLDLSRIFDEYGKTKEYDQTLEKKHAEYEEERNEKLTKIRDAQAKLALLKEEEKTKLQEQMDKDRAELLEFDRKKQTDLKKQRDDKIREILLEIEKIVKDFAKKEKYSLILNDRVLIYGDEKADISEEILKILNSGK